MIFLSCCPFLFLVVDTPLLLPAHRSSLARPILVSSKQSVPRYEFPLLETNALFLIILLIAIVFNTFLFLSIALFCAVAVGARAHMPPTELKGKGRAQIRTPSFVKRLHDVRQRERERI